MSATVIEVKKAKRKLESDICELINKFQVETSVSVTNVDIHRTPTIGLPLDYVGSVSVDLVL